jgi:hypothetical protein
MWFTVFWKAYKMETKKTPTADKVLEIGFNIFTLTMALTSAIVISAAGKWDAGDSAGVLVPFCLFLHSPSWFGWVAVYMFFCFYALVGR